MFPKFMTKSSNIIIRQYQQRCCLSTSVLSSSSQNSFIVSSRSKKNYNNNKDAVGNSIRNLNVHEYISMELMKQHGVNVPDCYVATSAHEAQSIFTKTINKRKL